MSAEDIIEHNRRQDTFAPSEASPPDLTIVNDQGASSEASFEADLFAHRDFDSLYNYSVEDLHTLFTVQDMNAIEAYQFSAGDTLEERVDALINNPLPTFDNDAFNRRLKALLNNTEYYDEAIEDFVAADEMIQAFIQKRSSVRGSAELYKKLTQAFRVRRSVLAFFYQPN